MNESSPLQIIVCERWGHWTASLRSLPLTAAIRIVELQTLEHVEQQLETTLAAIVCLETTPTNVIEVYRWLWNSNERYPYVRCVVMIEPWPLLDRPTEAEFLDNRSSRTEILNLLHEAGAIHGLSSTRDVQQLLSIANRYLSQGSFVTLNSSGHGGDPRTLEHIWANLPWTQ